MATVKHSYIQQLQCAGVCGELFNVVLERKSDLTASHLSDTGDPTEGYAIYRDKVFVKCPHCFSLCRLGPLIADVEVIKRA
jgi:hypothetical protein